MNLLKLYLEPLKQIGDNSSIYAVWKDDFGALMCRKLLLEEMLNSGAKSTI